MASKKAAKRKLRITHKIEFALMIRTGNVMRKICPKTNRNAAMKRIAIPGILVEGNTSDKTKESEIIFTVVPK